MSDYTFGGQPCVAGTLLLPACGVGTAEIYLSEPDAPISVGQSADLVVLGVARRMTVLDAGSEYGTVRARLVQGAGRMDTILDPQEWQGYQLGQIARDSLQEAGEEAGGGWDTLTDFAAHWTRPQGPLRECLRRVARLLPDDRRWRAARDGSIALVTESWPDNSASVDTSQYSWPQERCAQWYPADGSAEPGQEIDLFGTAQRIQRAEYRWGSSEVTVRGWW